MKTLTVQQALDALIEKNAQDGIKPTLLLHCCCGPCATYPLAYLTPYFRITALFYNPNIQPDEEYERRKEAFLALMRHHKDVTAWVLDEDKEAFAARVRGMEHLKEGQARCTVCIEMRLGKTAELSSGFDYFATTLTVSPHKNAPLINAIGKKVEQNDKARYLLTDFKKKDGFLMSTKLSEEYGLYRQSYCGCIITDPKD